MNPFTSCAEMSQTSRSFRSQQRKLYSSVTSAQSVIASPEALLLIECSQTVINAEAAKRIRSLLRNEIDWDYVLRKAHLNSVTPLLCRTLIKSFPELVPASVLEKLNDYFHSNARRNLLLTGKLIKFLQLLSADKIPALPLKGPTLAVMAYGDLSLRHFVDLDILVRKRDISRVTALLIDQGYKSLSTLTWLAKLPVSNGKDIGFISEDGQVVIELHWRLSGTHFDLPLKLNSIWGRLATMSLAKTSVNTLSPNDLLLYLCLHGSRHCWERLEWVSDVAELIRSQQHEMDWETITEHAHLLGCERVLALGLYLIYDFWGVTVPVPNWQSIKDDLLNKSLALHVRERLFREPDSSLEISDWYFYHLGLKERSQDRWRVHLYYYFRYLRLAVRPNKQDHDFVRLPRLLNPLYYLLRPVRLVNEYGFVALRKYLRGLKF